MVHPNTILNWQNAVVDKLKSERLLGSPPWNRLHDGVRRLVHEIREAFPEPEFRTRTIARHIVRAGIGISRSSVRRVFQEGPKDPSQQHYQPRVTTAPSHVRHPTKPNQVRHMDLTEIRVLWKKIEIAAIVDGIGRTIIAIKEFGRRSTSHDMSKLVEESVESSGRCRGF